EQALDGDELVAGFVGDLLGRVEHARQLGSEIDLPPPPPPPLGPPRPGALGGRPGPPPAAPRPLNKAHRPAPPVIERAPHPRSGAKLRVPVALRNSLRRLHEAFGAISVLLEVHASLLGTGARPKRAREPPSSDRIETKPLPGPRAAPGR